MWAVVDPPLTSSSVRSAGVGWGGLVAAQDFHQGPWGLSDSVSCAGSPL